MTVTPIRSAGRSASKVDVYALSQPELEVAFYAADYHRTGDEVLAGGDVLRMSAAVAQVLTDHGVGHIRDVAALLEYATLHGDTAMMNRLMPDGPRREHSRCNARCLKRLLSAQLPAVKAAHLVGSWQTTLHGVTEAVAA